MQMPHPHSTDSPTTAHNFGSSKFRGSAFILSQRDHWRSILKGWAVYRSTHLLQESCAHTLAPNRVFEGAVYAKRSTGDLEFLLWAGTLNAGRWSRTRAVDAARGAVVLGLQVLCTILHPSKGGDEPVFCEIEDFDVDRARHPV